MESEDKLKDSLKRERKAKQAAKQGLEEAVAAKTAELRRTALRISNVISNMQEGVLVEDENRRIALVNPGFCTMFGIPVAAELLIGTDCSGSAEQAKHLFADPEGFVEGINQLLAKRE